MIVATHQPLEKHLASTTPNPSGLTDNRHPNVENNVKGTSEIAVSKCAGVRSLDRKGPLVATLTIFDKNDGLSATWDSDPSTLVSEARVIGKLEVRLPQGFPATPAVAKYVATSERIEDVIIRQWNPNDGRALGFTRKRELLDSGQSFSKKPKSESGFSIKREEDGDDGDDFYPLDDDDGNDPNSITPSDAWIRTTLRRQAPDEKISEASKGFTDALESTAERRPEALIAQQESVRPGAEEAIQDQSDVYEVVTQPGIDSQDHPIVSFEWFQHQGQCQLPATQKRKSRDSVRYTNKYHFAFGEDKLPNHIKPTPEDMAAVSAILKEERPTLESGRVQASGRLPQVSACTPVRAGTGITVDSLVRVIMSQCCRNETALDIQQTLIRAYPYDVEGSTYFGEKPNYHAMRIESVKKLATVIKRAGLGERKSQRIKECLDMIYAKNVELLPPGDVVYESNEPGAKDFVPGLLSLDYLHDIYAQGGKQGLFDYLVSFPQIGVKSACCLMSFNMELPVFAVDTHVAAMVKLLGWVPEDCKDEATMAGHLDARMLDGDEKIQLHQDLWRHRRNCVRCSGRAKPHSPAWQNTVCPLEHLVRRHTPGGAPVEENSDLLRAEPSPEKGRTTAFKRQPVSSEEDMRPAGLVKVTYKLDDNFDTAGANITERTTWIRDFSNVAFDIDGETDEESNGEDHEQLTPGRRDLPRN